MRANGFLLSLFLLSAGIASPAAAADAVARIGETEISVDEVRTFLDTLPETDRAALVKEPALLSQTVRQYLLRRQVLAAARNAKFDATPEVKAKLEAARDTALIELYLQSVSAPPANFPSEADLQTAYEANKSAFVTPRQYRLAQIYIAAPKGDKAAEDKGKAKLAELQRSLKAKDADFGRAAAQFSDIKAEAEKGGEIGWVPESQIVPDIRSLAAGLAKGGVSEPLRLDDGWHIIKLLDTKPAGTLPLAEIKGALSERLRQAQAQQTRQSWLAALAQQTPVTVNELALSKLVSKTR